MLTALVQRVALRRTTCSTAEWNSVFRPHMHEVDYSEHHPLDGAFDDADRIATPFTGRPGYRSTREAARTVMLKSWARSVIFLVFFNTSSMLLIALQAVSFLLQNYPTPKAS
ncbi:hypothetical protein Y032_0363g3544 [Ancylostoma ceylanicum]|uniref:Uncharacterized protein n=1 Tax=Ancylostoma ceylanicum TaxID=53326 RepID=A0A016RW01_9BILA|nr:hypothetical protein Y032_0363g3544 [Ancylostoma ceylanicum]